MTEPCINPDTNAYPDDYLIAKAFESLRVRFGQRMDFPAFVRSNWKRAELILRVEGRATDIVVKSLTPFAEAQSDRASQHKQRRREIADSLRGEFPHMARMIERGQI